MDTGRPIKRVHTHFGNTTVTTYGDTVSGAKQKAEIKFIKQNSTEPPKFLTQT